MIWRIKLMGAFGLTDGSGMAVPLSPLAAQALAWLAWRLGQPNNREALIERFWPETPPAIGRNRLNVLLHTLRTQLEPDGVPRGSVLLTHGDTVILLPDIVGTDVGEFRSLLASARGHGAGAALERATQLYDQPLLGGLYADWATAEQEVLADLYLEAAQQLVEAHLRSGQLEDALRVARAAVAHERLREEAHALVIRAALAQGDVAAARRQWAELERVFRRELKLAPSPALRRLVYAAQDRAVAAPPASPAVVDTPLAPGLAVLVATASTANDEQAWLRSLVRQHQGRLATATDADALAEFGSLSSALRYLEDLGRSGRRSALVTADLDSASPRGMSAGRQRAVRLAAAAQPGQVLCDDVTAALLRRADGELGEVRLLGEFELLPGHSAEYVYQADVPGGQQTFGPPTLPPAASLGAVPRVRSRFYGRAEDLADVRARLTQDRLVTLKGTGGSGKTRLAIELCRSCQAQGETTWFVELATATRADQVVPFALSVMGESLAGDTDPLERMVWLLRERPALLVLDNFEHLPEDAAAVVWELADRVPGQRVLVTSRRRLGIDGEAVHDLAGLPVPTAAAGLDQVAQSASVALFVNRAQAVRPSFRLSEHNRAAVVELCIRLDGLPLAVEIAAAHARLHSVAGLVESLGEHLRWRAPRAAGRPERQQTLDMALAWSWNLVPRDQQEFLASLVIFRTPFTATDTAAVLAEPAAAERLARLCDSSLVHTVGETPELRRFLLETIRQFVAQKLEPERREWLAQRHAEHFARRLSDVPPEAMADPALVSSLDHQYVDYRAALAWLEAHDPPAGLRLATAMMPLWERSHRDADGWQCLTRLLAAVPEAPAEQQVPAWLAALRCSFAGLSPDENTAWAPQAVAAVRQAGDSLALAQALWNQALCHSWREIERLPAIRDELDDLAQRTGHPLPRLFALDAESMRRASLGQTKAWEPMVEAVRIVDAIGDPMMQMMHLTQLALNCSIDGLLDEAEQALDRMPAGVLEAGSGYWHLRARLAWAWVHADRRRWRLAAEALTQAAAQLTAAPTAIQGYVCMFIGRVLPPDVVNADAVLLVSAALAGVARYDLSPAAQEMPFLRGIITAAEARLDRQTLAAAEAAGRTAKAADLAAAMVRVAQRLTARPDGSE